MTSPIRENLVGYLIGALEEHERAEVEDALAGDLHLRHELEVLERSLEVVAADRGHYDPPPRLGQRALQYVYQRSEVMPAALSSVRGRDIVPYRRWSFADVGVAAGIFLAASLLFWPAINSSRASAQLAACQNNLRVLGVALTKFSDLNPSGMFPTVPIEGNLAAGGMYAPTLISNELLTEENAVLCPSDIRFANLPEEFSIPRPEAIMAAQGEQLREMQRLMGGSYGYTLGHYQNGEYRGTKNLRRPYFAIMADAPIKECTGSDNHGRRGQNVLFEDGHTEYVTSCELKRTGDHMYFNMKNKVAPGEGADDTVITNEVIELLLRN